MASVFLPRLLSATPTEVLSGPSARSRVANRAGIEAALAAEDEGMRALAGSPENIEAVKAFLEKRKPDFRQFRRR